MMWIVAGLIASIPLTALIYLACQNGRFRVRRSLEFEVPVESAFAAVLDLKSWPHWSPWLMHEPETSLDYSKNCQAEGGYYCWDGKVVGAGKVTHLKIRAGRGIHQQIEFQRPFKAVNQIDWEFENRDGSCLVSWKMSGKMPFLLRFMAKRMEPTLGRGFELGLALLGGYLNDAMAHPAFELAGEEELQDFSYWAIPCNGNLRQIEAARRSSIDRLRSSATSRVGLSLTLYHQFDPLGVQFQTETAIPIGNNTPTSNYQQHGFRGGHYCKMTLQGDLKFLPLAWYALASHCRLHKIKYESTRPALEIYQVDPAENDIGNQTVTTLYLPIKS
jgi:hypothetical protein